MTTNTKDQQAELEQIAREALMATREGKLDWEESFRPGAFCATIPLRYSPDTTQIEMLGKRDTGAIRLVLWHNGNPVAGFEPGPAQQEELRALLDDLRDNTEQREERVRQALEGLQSLRADREGVSVTTATRKRWSIERTVNGLDESEESHAELEVRVHFHDHQGATVEWEFWEMALDYFLQYDDLNTLMHDTDHWHSRTEEGLLTGVGFEFDLDGVELWAPNLILDGEAIRYTATETLGGDLHTHREEGCIVSRVKFQMTFQDKDRARPVLAHLTGKD